MRLSSTYLNEVRGALWEDEIDTEHLVQALEAAYINLDAWQEFFNEYDATVAGMLSIHFGSNSIPQELHDKYRVLQEKLNATSNG